MKQDIKGKRFGKLVVKEKTTKKGHCGSYLWKCVCDCGNETHARPCDLKTGHKNSCGCLRIEKSQKRRKRKMIGMRYGRLVVLQELRRDVGKEKSKRLFYKCMCDCGNEKVISGNSLVLGKTKSCGCMVTETSTENITKHLNKVLVEGTKLDNLTQKISKNNSSGHKGVSWDKRRSLWIAHLTWNKKTVYLGRFEKKEDAIKARKEAEDKYFAPVLEKYGKVDECKVNP